MNKNELDIKVQALLEGSLTAQEKTQLREQLEADPGLAQHVAQTVLQEDVLEIDLRERMQQWAAAAPMHSTTGNRWFSAKIILPLIGILLLLWLLQPGEETRAPAGQPPTENEKIAWNHYAGEPFLKDLEERSRSAGEDTTGDAAGFILWAESYQAGQYAEVATALESQDEDHLNYWGNRLLLAHTYFRQRRYQEAGQLFAAISTQTDASQYHDEAAWFGLLNRFALDGRAAILSDLEIMVADAEHTFQVEAQELLDDLK